MVLAAEMAPVAVTAVQAVMVAREAAVAEAAVAVAVARAAVADARSYSDRAVSPQKWVYL